MRTSKVGLKRKNEIVSPGFVRQTIERCKREEIVDKGVVRSVRRHYYRYVIQVSIVLTCSLFTSIGKSCWTKCLARCCMSVQLPSIISSKKPLLCSFASSRCCVDGTPNARSPRGNSRSSMLTLKIKGIAASNSTELTATYTALFRQPVLSGLLLAIVSGTRNGDQEYYSLMRKSSIVLVSGTFTRARGQKYNIQIRTSISRVRALDSYKQSDYCSTTVSIGRWELQIQTEMRAEY
jgi:hypothetical protein